MDINKFTHWTKNKSSSFVFSPIKKTRNINDSLPFICIVHSKSNAFIYLNIIISSLQPRTNF